MRRITERRATRGLVVAMTAAVVITCVSPTSPASTSSLESIQDGSVLHASISSVTVSLTASQLQVGATTQATATVSPLTRRRINWQSSHPSIATVSGSGVVTAVSVGSASIIASIGGVSGAASLTVAAPPGAVPIAAVVVDLTPASIAVNATALATARAVDSSGNVLTGRALTWHSTNPAVAVVNASGIVTGIAPGSAGVVATAAGGGPADTAALSVMTPVVTSISMTPSVVTLASGATQQFSVTGTLTGGGSTTPPVTYMVSGGGTMSAGGLFTAGTTTGTFQVIARLTGGTIADTSSVTIIAGSGVAPIVEETFGNYTSTSHLISNPFGTFRPAAYDERTADISLDMTSGFGSDRSMKFTFPDQTANSAGRCTIDYSISRWVKFPAPVREVWVEVYVKFSANFTTVVPASWGCGGNPDYKLIFLANDPPNGRWQIKNGTYGTHWSPNHNGGSNDTYITTNAGNGGTWWDGQWHRLRWHARVSTTLTSADGAFEYWLDDVKQTYPSNINTSAGGLVITALTDVRLGANLNLGPSQTQSVNWGRIRVYATNPGW
jgi:hypothetical protein